MNAERNDGIGLGRLSSLIGASIRGAVNLMGVRLHRLRKSRGAVSGGGVNCARGFIGVLLVLLLLAVESRAQGVAGDFEARSLQGGTIVQVELKSGSLASTAATLGFSGRIIRDGLVQDFPSSAVLARRASQSVDQSLWDFEATGIHGLAGLRLKYDAKADSLQVAFGVSSSDPWVDALRSYRVSGVRLTSESYVFAYRLDMANPLASSGSLSARLAARVAESAGLSAGSSSAAGALEKHRLFQAEVERVRQARATAVANLQKVFQTAGATVGGSLQMGEVAGLLVESVLNNFKNPFEGDGNTYVTSLLQAVTKAASEGELNRAYFEAGLGDVEELYPPKFTSAAKLSLAKNVSAELGNYRSALLNYRLKALGYRSDLVGRATTRETSRSAAKTSLAGVLQSSTLRLNGVMADVAENLLGALELHLNEAVDEAQGTQQSGVLWVSELESRVVAKSEALGGRLTAGTSASVMGQSDVDWVQQVVPGFEEWPDGVWVALSESLPEGYSIANLKSLLRGVFPRLTSYLESYRGVVLEELGRPLSSEDLKSIDEYQWVDVLDVVAYERFRTLWNVRVAQQAANERAVKSLQFNVDTLRNWQGYGWATVRFGTLSARDSRLVAEISGVSPAGVSWQATPLVRVDSQGQAGWLGLNLLSGTAATSAGSATGGSGAGVPFLSGLLPVRVTGLSSGTSSGGSLSVSLGTPGSQAALEWNGIPCTVEGPLPIRVGSGSSNLLGQAGPVQVVLGLEDPGQKTAMVGFGATVGVAAPGSELDVTPSLRIHPAGSELRVVMGSLAGSGTASSARAGRFSGKYPATLGSSTSPGLGTFQGVLMPSGETSAPLGFGFIQTGPASTLVVKLAQPEASAEELDPVAPVISAPVIGWKGISGSVLTLNVGTSAAVSRTTVQLLRAGTVLAGGTLTADSSGRVQLPLSNLSSGSDYQIRVRRAFLSRDTQPVESGSFTVVQRSAAGTFQSLLQYEQPFQAGSGSPNGNPYRARLTITSTDTGTLSGKLEWVDLKPVRDEDGQPAPSWVSDPTIFPTEVEGGSGGLSFQTRLPAVISYTLAAGTAKWEPSKTSGVTGQVFEEEGLSMNIPVLTSSRVNTGHQLKLYLRQDSLGTPVDPNRSPGSPIPRMEMAMVLSGTSMLGGGSMLVGSSVPAVSGTVISRGVGSYATAGSGLGWLKLRDTYSWTVSSSRVTYVWRRGTTSKSGSTTLGLDGSIPFFLLMDRIELPKLGTSTLTTTAVGMMEARLELQRPVVNPLQPVYEIVADSPTYVTGTTLDSLGNYKKAWFPLPSTYLGVTPGGFGWAEWMLTRTLPKVQESSGRVEVGRDYELRLENTRTGEIATATVRGSGTLPGVGSTLSFPSSVSLTPTVGGSGSNLSLPSSSSALGALVLTRLSVTNATGQFSGSVRAPWSASSGTLTGNYVRDDRDAGSNLVARGVSADTTVVWSLYRK
jgi:hypothetical protein